jgi:hypothetical protein
MQDLLWIGITITFFLLSIAYVRFCERLKWERAMFNPKVEAC